MDHIFSILESPWDWVALYVAQYCVPKPGDNCAAYQRDQPSVRQPKLLRYLPRARTPTIFLRSDIPMGSASL